MASAPQTLRENFIIAVVWALFAAPLLYGLLILLNWLLEFLSITGWHAVGLAKVLFFPASFVFTGLGAEFLANPFYAGFYRDLSGSGILNIIFMFILLSAIRLLLF